MLVYFWSLVGLKDLTRNRRAQELRSFGYGDTVRGALEGCSRRLFFRRCITGCRGSSVCFPDYLPLSVCTVWIVGLSSSQFLVLLLHGIFPGSACYSAAEWPWHIPMYTSELRSCCVIYGQRGFYIFLTISSCGIDTHPTITTFSSATSSLSFGSLVHRSHL